MRNDIWINIAYDIQEMYDCNDCRGYFDALKVIYVVVRK